MSDENIYATDFLSSQRFLSVSFTRISFKKIIKITEKQ